MMSKTQIKIKVLDAAAGLLEDGGEGFTMQQLEARVDISRASIYRHVGGKEEIMALLILNFASSSGMCSTIFMDENNRPL